jgi:hypothetical protein
MPDPKLYLYQIETICFETYDEPCTTEHEANITYTFDYEKLFDGTKRVYIDIGLKFQHAALQLRCGTEFDGEGLSWNDVFTHDFLYPIAKASVDTAYQDFAEECEEANNPYKYGLEVNEDIPEQIINNMIEKYRTHRIIDDLNNEYLLNNIGLECETGTDSILIIKTTFIILDELLYLNPLFNRPNNREAFSDVVPLPRYLTLKFNCLAIEYEDVQLSFYFAIFYYLSLDCALQMLVSDKATMIIETLESKSITKEMQHEYIKLGTDLFNQLKESLVDSKARFTNLENLKDWNQVLR